MNLLAKREKTIVGTSFTVAYFLVIVSLTVVVSPTIVVSLSITVSLFTYINRL
jgi:hypothetical protein